MTGLAGSSMERLSSEGRSLWRTDTEHAVPVGSVEVTTAGERAVAVVSATAARPDLGMPAPQAWVFDLEGEARCGMAMDSAEAGVIAAVSGHSSSGAIAMVGAHESGVWISGLDVLR